MTRPKREPLMYDAQLLKVESMEIKSKCRTLTPLKIQRYVYTEAQPVSMVNFYMGRPTIPILF